MTLECIASQAIAEIIYSANMDKLIMFKEDVNIGLAFLINEVFF